ASATTNAKYIAMPPMRGVGSLCTLRSSGMSTAPTRDASARTNGVTKNETAAATAKTMRKGRTRSVRDADPRRRERAAQLCDLCRRVVVRPALEAGEHRAVEDRGVLGLADEHGAARPTERLVGGRCNDVGKRNR